MSTFKDNTDKLCSILGLTPVHIEGKRLRDSVARGEEGWHSKGGYKAITYTWRHSDGRVSHFGIGGMIDSHWLLKICQRNQLTIKYFEVEGGEGFRHRVIVSGEEGSFEGGGLLEALVQYLQAKWNRIGEDVTSEYPMDQDARPNWCSIY